MTGLLHDFFYESPHIFILLDKNLNLAEINKAGLRYFQLQEDSIGKKISDIFPGILENGQAELLSSLTEHVSPVPIDIKLSEWKNLYCQVFAAGEGIGITCSDTSEHKESIDELTHFAYRISRDLRSPAVNILGLTTMAQREIKNEDALAYFGRIDFEMHRLASMLQTLIELTQVLHGDLNIQLISFERIIDNALKNISGVEGFSEIAFKKEISYNQKFYCDKNLLNTIFTQLFDNAIKFKQKESSDSFVRISIHDDSNGVKITVEDNGTGIKDHIKKDIFSMFFHTTEHSNSNGSGLGLYTVKRCVKKLNGDIQVESRSMKGTVFTIYLPSAK